MSELGETLIRIVREKASANPNFIYQPPREEGTGRPLACQYIRNGCPDCLIGHALFDAQLIDPSLEGLVSNHSTVIELLDYLGLQLEPVELRWIRNVQRAQDFQRPWGAAVGWADGDADVMSGFAA